MFNQIPIVFSQHCLTTRRTWFLDVSWCFLAMLFWHWRCEAWATHPISSIIIPWGRGIYMSHGAVMSGVAGPHPSFGASLRFVARRFASSSDPRGPEMGATQARSDTLMCWSGTPQKNVICWGKTRRSHLRNAIQDKVVAKTPNRIFFERSVKAKMVWGCLGCIISSRKRIQKKLKQCWRRVTGKTVQKTFKRSCRKHLFEGTKVRVDVGSEVANFTRSCDHWCARDLSLGYRWIGGILDGFWAWRWHGDNTDGNFGGISWWDGRWGIFGMFQRGSTFFFGRRLVAGLRSLPHLAVPSSPERLRRALHMMNAGHHQGVRRCTKMNEVLPSTTTYYMNIYMYTMYCTRSPSPTSQQNHILFASLRISSHLFTLSIIPPPNICQTVQTRLRLFSVSRWICFTQVV